MLPSLRRLTHEHPAITDRFRSLLANYTLGELLLLFVALLFAVTGVVALGYWLTATNHSFWFWWRQAVLELAATTTGVDMADTSFHAILQAVLAVLGLILPGFVLGIIVFKAFVSRDIFQVRRRLSLISAATRSADVRAELTSLGGQTYCLAIRLYSATKLDLVEVNFSLYVRIGSRDKKNVRSLANFDVALCKKHWPIALTHVPYTLFVPLGTDDVHEDPESGARQLVAIQGHGLGERCGLLLHVSGSIPDLNQEFLEAHWFDAYRDVSTDPYGEIDVDYDLPSSAWAGWDGFE